MQKSIIHIRTVQMDLISKEEETIELITEGTYSYDEDGLVIVYDESEISGMEGTTTTLKIYGDKVIMSRMGSSSSAMEFENGKRYKSTYKTQFGDMMMELLTTRVDVEKVEEPFSVDINIDYDIIVRDMFEGKNRMHIKIN